MATVANGGGVGKLAAEETALLVCDVQERFRPVITGFPAVIDTSKRMVSRARDAGQPMGRGDWAQWSGRARNRRCACCLRQPSR